MKCMGKYTESINLLDWLAMIQQGIHVIKQKEYNKILRSAIFTPWYKYGNINQLLVILRDGN